MIWGKILKDRDLFVHVHISVHVCVSFNVLREKKNDLGLYQRRWIPDTMNCDNLLPEKKIKSKENEMNDTLLFINVGWLVLKFFFSLSFYFTIETNTISELEKVLLKVS